MLTIAAPSTTIMSTSGTKLFASSVNGRRSSRHRSRSDFVASLNFPLSDIEGGDDWFSCWKISISHLTRDVYSWKQMPVPFHGQQLFRVWVFALSGRNLNKGTLFLGILSVTGVVCCTSRQLKNSLHWRSPSSFKLLTESMTHSLPPVYQELRDHCWYQWMGCPYFAWSQPKPSHSWEKMLVLLKQMIKKLL